MGKLASLNLEFDADGKFPELQGKKIHVTQDITVTTLRDGMSSGKPSVALLIKLDNGEVVFAETSMALFLTAADAMVARHGDQRT